VSTSAVLFDLDGTLVDLRAAYVKAHQRAALEVLSVDLDETRILELMSSGSPIRAHMARLNEAAADRLVAVFVERYREEREGLARPFPGIRRLLGGLRDQGVPLAVVTSKLREDAIAELAAAGLEDYVEVVVAFEDVDEHKPAPAPQLAALRRLGISSGIGVGDLPSDVASARAAGLRALAVAWGYGRAAGLSAAGAERVCHTVDELREALRELLGRRPPVAEPDPTAESVVSTTFSIHEAG
jgi:2-phosphoglycolate phosphatase